MHYVTDVDDDYEIIGFYQLVSSKPPIALDFAFRWCVWTLSTLGRQSSFNKGGKKGVEDGRGHTLTSVLRQSGTL